MTKYERFVLWLNRFYHKQNKITICVLYTLIMAILGVLIYGATHQQASSNISVRYTRPTYTVTFDPNGGELSTIGGGVSSKQIRLCDTYGDLPVPTRTGYVFLGWRGKNLVNIPNGVYSEYVSVSNSVITVTKSTTANQTKVFSALQLKPNTEYTVSCKIQGAYTGRIYGFLMKNGGCYGSLYAQYVDSNGNFNCTYTTSDTGIDTDKGQIIFVQGTGVNDEDINIIGDKVVISNIMLCEGTSTAYEPYYIESDTVFGTPGDRTLTAMWSQDNILTGGALQTESDLAQWRHSNIHDGTEENFSYGVASIVAEDNYSCAKIVGEQHRAKQIFQSVLGKLEAKRMYSITAKIKLVNMIKHENTSTDSYFDPVIMLYSTGYVGSTWFRPINYGHIPDYNNQGWVDVRFVGLSCPEVADDFDISQATSISFAIFIANYSGTLYIRDFAIAKM